MLVTLTNLNGRVITDNLLPRFKKFLFLLLLLFVVVAHKEYSIQLSIRILAF